MSTIFTYVDTVDKYPCPSVHNEIWAVHYQTVYMNDLKRYFAVEDEKQRMFLFLRFTILNRLATHSDMQIQIYCFPTDNQTDYAFFLCLTGKEIIAEIHIKERKKIN